MKKVVIFSFALFAGIVVFAQKVTPSSNVITEQRTVLNFSQLAVFNGIEVVVVNANTERVEISAPDNVVQFVETVVDKGVLNVRLRRGLKLRGSATIQVTVSAKSLNSISAVKSKVTFENTFTADRLTIHLDDASMSGHLAIQRGVITLVKKAKTDLAGACADLRLTLSGGSTFGNTSFAADVLDARLSKQSTARLTIIQSVNFVGSKGSKLHYLGNPLIRGIKASGDSGLMRAD